MIKLYMKTETSDQSVTQKRYLKRQQRESVPKKKESVQTGFWMKWEEKEKKKGPGSLFQWAFIKLKFKNIT